MAQQIKSCQPKGLPVGWYWDFIPVMIVKITVTRCCEGLASVDPRIPRCKRFGGSLGVLLQSRHHFHSEYNPTEIEDFLLFHLPLYSSLFPLWKSGCKCGKYQSNSYEWSSRIFWHNVYSIDFSCILMHPYSPQKERQVKGTLCKLFLLAFFNYSTLGASAAFGFGKICKRQVDDLLRSKTFVLPSRAA